MIAQFKRTLTVGVCLLVVSATILSAKENRVAVKSDASPEFSRIRASGESQKASACRLRRILAAYRYWMERRYPAHTRHLKGHFRGVWRVQPAD